MDHFAGLDVLVKETSVCIMDDRARSFGKWKVASEPEALVGGAEKPRLHFKRIGLEAGRCRSGFTALSPKPATGGLCRDATHAGGAEGTDEQDEPQRCPRHRADDAGGALPSGACEDATQSNCGCC